jgi:hypothetical protein
MMRALQQGLVRSAQNWRMNLLIYVFNLAFAAIFALAFRSVVSGEFEMRDVSARLLDGFDFTFLSDMRYAQASITSLSSVILWLILFYAIFGIFISGGVIASIQRNAAFSLSFFFSNAAAYSGKFMQIASVFSALCLVPILIISGFSFAGQSASQSSMSETPLMIWTIIGAGLAFLTGSYFYLVVEYAKFGIIFEDLKIFKALKRGFEMVSKHFPAVFGVFLSFAGLLFFLIVVFNALVPKAQSGGGVLMMFIIQQAFILGRVFLRNSLIGSELAIYESLPKPSQIEKSKPIAAKSDSGELDSEDGSSTLLGASLPLSNAMGLSRSSGSDSLETISPTHLNPSDNNLIEETTTDIQVETSSSEENFSTHSSANDSLSASSDSSASNDSSSSDSSSSGSSSSSD